MYLYIIGAAAASRVILAVVDIRLNEQPRDAPWKQRLGLEAKGERFPQLLERLQQLSHARVVVAKNLRCGENAQIHFCGNADFEVEVPGVERGGEAVFEAGVCVRLVSDTKTACKLLHCCLQQRH